MMFLLVLLVLFSASCAEECRTRTQNILGYYYYTYYTYCSSCCGDYYSQFCCYYDSYSDDNIGVVIGTVVGSVIGGIIVISIIVCVVCLACKKSSQGRVIVPANMNPGGIALVSSNVTSSAYPHGPVYPQGVQPSHLQATHPSAVQAVAYAPPGYMPSVSENQTLNYNTQSTSTMTK